MQCFFFYSFKMYDNVFTTTGMIILFSRSPVFILYKGTKKKQLDFTNREYYGCKARVARMSFLTNLKMTLSHRQVMGPSVLERSKGIFCSHSTLLLLSWPYIQNLVLTNIKMKFFVLNEDLLILTVFRRK